MKKFSNFKKPVSIAVFLIALLFSIDLVCIGILAANELIHKRPINDFFLDKFFLTRPFRGLTRQSADMALFESAKQKNIGNLLPTSQERWRDFMPADSILGIRIAPNVKCTHYNKYIYISNDQGFLATGGSDFHYEPRKDADIYRIIVVGGSTVLGQGASTPGESLPAQIYNYLVRTQASGKEAITYEVINAGIGGYSSNQEFLYILTDLLRYDPDLVIVYDGWNDSVYNNLLLGKLGDRVTPLKSVMHYDIEKRLNKSYHVLGSLSLFLGVTKSHINAILDRTGTVSLLRMAILKMKNTNNISKASPFSYYPRSAEIYKENLEKMIMLSKFYNFKIAIFLQPIMGVDDKTLTGEEQKSFSGISDLECRERFYDDARNALEELRQKYADGTNVIVKDLSKTFSYIAGTVYADSGHLLLEGNKILAGEIVESLNLDNRS